MAHTGIFATADECKLKAGAKVSATATTEANINMFCSMAEGFINSRTLKNWSELFPSLDADLKTILTDVESSLVGIYLITYDMGGYTSRQEALTMLNVLWARVDECLKVLEKEANRSFVAGE